MSRRRRRRVRSSAPAPEPERLEVDVTAVGGRGDGLADTADGRRLYVPFAAPGDRVRVVVGAARGEGFAATVEQVLQEGPRAAPFCPHFGCCGGCATQHLPAPLEAEWKRDLVATALARRGLAAPVAAPVVVQRASRRRVTLTAERRGDGVVLGFNAPGSRRVVDVAACPLLVTPLNDLRPALARLLAGLAVPGARLVVQLTAAIDGGGETALDMVLAAPRPPTLDERQALAAFAEAEDLARIAWCEGDDRPEPVAHRRDVQVRFAEVAVDLPPGAFLQASAEGETAIRDAVLDGLGVLAAHDGGLRVADLYAGLGTLALPLARALSARVDAVDGDTAAMAALATAAGRSGLGGRIHTGVRDLTRRPLTAAELRDFDAVVFDPPRAGARAQAEQLAATPGLGLVVAVSCNPTTFARDARILVDGGFALGRVQPIDQFRHAPHVELVAEFSR